MICNQHSQLITDVPLMVQGKDKYTTCNETVYHLIHILAYNKLPEVKKPIKYENLMKSPVIKKGKDTVYPAKFIELSAIQLKLCVEQAEILLSAIRWLDSEIVHREDERARLANEKRMQEQQEVYESTKAVITKDVDIRKAFLDAFHVNAAGIDDAVAELVLLSFLGTREISGDGLHLKLSAESGQGKTYSTNAALHALPQQAFYSGAFSDRALVYDESLRDGTIIKLDEMQSKSESFESLVKESVSSYQTGVIYRTVIDKVTVSKELKPRLTFILLSVDGWGDEQTASRFIPLGLTNRAGKESQLTNFRLKKREDGVPKLYTNEIVENSRKVLEHFLDHKFRAKIPFVKNIHYNTNDQRAQEWFESVIMYHAVLCYKNRKHEIDEEGIITVEASQEDFDYCNTLEIFKSVEKISHRFSDSEIEIVRLLQKHNYEGSEITRADLVRLSGKSDSRISQILNGRQDRDKNGLMAKLGITEVNISSAEYTEISIGDRDMQIPKSRISEKAYRIPLLPNVGTSGSAPDVTFASWKN